MPKYMSHTDFLSRMQVVHNTSIKVLGKYVRSSEYILVKCTTCNTKWKTRPSSLLYGCGCKTCKMKAVGIAQRKTNKQYLQEVASIHKNKIKPLGIFTTVATLTKRSEEHTF